MGIIQFKEANCKNCYKCIRSCEVKSIAFKNEQAEIIEKECILCGHCFLACPQNAKSIKSDMPKIREMIARGEKVYVSLAPSYMGAFHGANISSMSAALKKLGFCHVEETAIGASRVSAEYAQLINEHKMKNIITTCCPTAVLLVEKYYPELIPYLAPVVSPMVAHAKMMREVYGSRIKVVFAGPCISKIYEAEDDLAGTSGVNAVMMFEELKQWLEEEGISIGEDDADGREMDDVVNRLYPVPGGILRTLAPKKAKKYYHTVAVDGVDRCREIFDSLRDTGISGYFIEVSACPGSCLQGPGVKRGDVPFLIAKDDVLRSAKGKLTELERPVSEDTEVEFGKVFIDRHPDGRMPSEEEIRAVLALTGKTAPEKQLNCGGCGYQTCREKAIAVCQGKADIRMCLPYMREKAESISNIVIDNTPNGIIILNERLEIVEYNPAAAELFQLSGADYTGRPITDVFDCDDLTEVYRTGRDILADRAYYPELDLALEQSIIKLQDDSMYLLLLKDISKEVEQQKELADMRNETAMIAQKVIDKQMRVAQEIASLLGETTAETKLALTRLKKSITADGEAK